MLSRSVRQRRTTRPRDLPYGEQPLQARGAHCAFVVHAEKVLIEPAAPPVLGIDETRRGRPRWTKQQDGSWVRLERFETNFVDLSGPASCSARALAGPRRQS